MDVTRATKSNRVPQPTFLATVSAGGPGGGAPGSPCLVAFHCGGMGFAGAPKHLDMVDMAVDTPDTTFTPTLLCPVDPPTTTLRPPHHSRG